ncbi:hypothetical protein [Novosphingobium sp.]|uniref:hypothetical protein n=1 Tax=Novosphingobium sp. TaxID=1874826 RepID=UPI00262D887F|nr:hypothetical protein [Novosphingobium sp.]
MAMAKQQEEDLPQELSGVVIGWGHQSISRNIQLTVQSTVRAKPTPGSVDTHHLLMTRNQAMLLAQYLMRLTGQEMPVPRKRGWVQRLFG